MQAIERLQLKTVRDMKQICAYLQAGLVFDAAISIKKNNSYCSMPNAKISEISVKHYGHFVVKDFDPLEAGLIDLRIILSSSFMDFSADVLDAASTARGFCRLSFPKEITVYFRRKNTRIIPSMSNPIRMNFLVKHLYGLSQLARVTDISLGGIGLELPNAESLFRMGTIIEKIEILLPGEGTCTFSGQIRYVCENRCGISFIQSDIRDIEKIANYVNKKQLIQNAQRRTYKPIQDLETGMGIQKK